MIKRIGVVLFALFAVEVVGCNWFWNQKPVCDEKSPNYTECMNPPPLPPMVAMPDAVSDTSDADDGLLLCPADMGTDGG